MDWTFPILIAIAVSIAGLVIYLWIRGRYSRAPRVTPADSEQAISERAVQSDDVDTLTPSDLDIPQIPVISIERHELVEQIQEEQRQQLDQSGEHPSMGMGQAQAETPQEEEKRAERKRVKPIERGGKPRGRVTKPKRQKPKQESMRALKPDIICWRRQTEWVLGIEVPNEYGAPSQLKVVQDGVALERVSYREGCWRLEKVSGKVTVVGQEGVPSEIILGEEPYLVFKLSGSDLNQGRHVKSVSEGWYLVVVPQDWGRHEVSGPPPVEPEYVVIEGFRAHFFLLERGLAEDIAFRTVDGVLNRIKTERPRFELIGNQYNDGSEDIGLLFLQEPPKIRVPKKRQWETIQTAIVGEEGPGRGKWRMEFKPTPELREQALPIEVAEKEAGWFFLKFYDDSDDLVESLDFRFARGLEKIALSTSPPLPDPEGHLSALVEFHHAPNYEVVPSCDTAESLQISCHQGKTTVEVPPNSNLDRTEWQVGPRDGPKTTVTVLVERLWWALSSEDKPPERWQDRHLDLSKEDFAAASQKAIWLRMPKRRWIKTVRAGFEYSKSRPYSLKVDEAAIVIPLREFGDFRKVYATIQALPLRVWIERGDQRADCFLAVLPPQPTTVSSEVEAAALSKYRWVGRGRKKSAFARAEMRLGEGEITVNGQPLRECFSRAPARAKRFLYRLLEMEQVREVLSKMDVAITVAGSSPTTTRQAKAVAHALARALIHYDPSMKPDIKTNGFGGAIVRRIPVDIRRRQG